MLKHPLIVIAALLTMLTGCLPPLADYDKVRIYNQELRTDSNSDALLWVGHRENLAVYITKINGVSQFQHPTDRGRLKFVSLPAGEYNLAIAYSHRVEGQPLETKYKRMTINVEENTNYALKTNFRLSFSKPTFKLVQLDRGQKCHFIYRPDSTAPLNLQC